MTDMRLTYVPIPNSHHLYLNGLEQQEGVDWTDDGNGAITFLSPMGKKSGDKVEVLYAHYGDTLLTEVNFLSAISGENAGSSRTQSFGGTATLDSLIVVAAQEDGSSVFSVPAGYTQIADQHTFFNHLAVFVKISDGTETSVTVTTTGGNRVAVAVAFYDRGLATQFSGSVGTVSSIYTFPTVPVASDTTRIIECVVGQHAISGLSLGAGNVIPDAIFRTGISSGTTALAIYDFVPGASGTSPVQSTSFATDRWCGATVAVD